MKKNVLQNFLVLMLLLSQTIGYAQNGVTIGSPSAPDNSAILDLKSSNKGFLPPRMSSTQRMDITSPAPGLIVFDTDKTQLYLYDGSSWQPLVGGTSGNSLYPTQFSKPAGDQASGYFGIDVDIYQNYAAIGASKVDSGTTLRTGAVFIYKKNITGAWINVARLHASDYQSNSYFGASVAMHGNYVVVAAPIQSLGGVFGAGKVYVFKKGAGDTWTEQTSFTKPGVPGVSDYFGFNVDVSTTTANGPAIIIGCPYADLGGADKGSAYTYRFNGTSWVYVQTLNPADLGLADSFGWEVTVDGDYCAISAPRQEYNTYTDAGAIYIFVSGGGVWTQQQKLLGSTASAWLGYSLHLQGDRLVAGAPFASQYTNTTAVTSVYKRSGASWLAIAQVYLIDNQGFDITNRFGIAVALDGENLLISMPGGYLSHNGGSSYNIKAGYVLVFRYSGTSYNLQKIINDNDPLPPGDANNMFGNSVSISNGNYVIGIPRKMINGLANAGSIAFGFLE